MDGVGTYVEALPGCLAAAWARAGLVEEGGFEAFVDPVRRRREARGALRGGAGVRARTAWAGGCDQTYPARPAV